MMDVYNHDYFECVCGIPEHTIRFTYVKDPIFDEDGEVYVETYLNTYHTWYGRLWIAIKYVLKIGKQDGCFDCTILNSTQCAKIVALLAKTAKVSEVNADKIN